MNYSQIGYNTFPSSLDFASGGGITDETTGSNNSSTAAMKRYDFAISANCEHTHTHMHANAHSKQQICNNSNSHD